MFSPWEEACALAQADIEQFFDSLPLLKLLCCLRRFLFQTAVLYAVFRHQAFTRLFVALHHSGDKVRI